VETRATFILHYGEMEQQQSLHSRGEGREGDRERRPGWSRTGQDGGTKERLPEPRTLGITSFIAAAPWLQNAGATTQSPWGLRMQMVPPWGLRIQVVPPQAP
jgi:hypothetical protein